MLFILKSKQNQAWGCCACDAGQRGWTLDQQQFSQYWSSDKCGDIGCGDSCFDSMVASKLHLNSDANLQQIL